MRRMLVDRARGKQRPKQSGDRQRVELEDVCSLTESAWRHPHRANQEAHKPDNSGNPLSSHNCYNNIGKKNRTRDLRESDISGGCTESSARGATIKRRESKLLRDGAVAMFQEERPMSRQSLRALCLLSALLMLTFSGCRSGKKQEATPIDPPKAPQAEMGTNLPPLPSLGDSRPRLLPGGPVSPLQVPPGHRSASPSHRSSVNGPTLPLPAPPAEDF